MVGFLIPVRVLRRHAMFSLATMLLLALGFGSVTLLLTAIHRLVVTPVRVPHLESLVRAAKISPTGLVTTQLPYTVFVAIQGRMNTLTDISADVELNVSYRDPGLPQAILGHLVSARYFALFEVRPFLGRILVPGDAENGGEGIVLSYNLWARRFHNRNVIGKIVFIQSQPFVVVGVMPRDFLGESLDSPADVWLPIEAYQRIAQEPITSPHADSASEILGRLKPTFTEKEATAEFGTVLQTLIATRPEIFGRNAYKDRVVMEQVNRRALPNGDEVSRALFLLLGAICAVFIAVIVNVAGLFLVRSAYRQREIAVRLSLGAGWLRLVRELGLESCMLTLLGAAVGVIAAYLVGPALLRWLPVARYTLLINMRPEPHIVGFCIALAIAVGILLTLISLWLGRPKDLGGALRSKSATARVGNVSRGLVMVQIALAVLLISGASLLIRTLVKLTETNPGFQVNNLAVFSLDTSMPGLQVASAGLPAELLAAVRSLPSIQDAGFAAKAVMEGKGLKTSAVPSGQRVGASQFMNTSMNIVSSTYFSTLSIPLVSGREFMPTDVSRQNPSPVLVNSSLARLLFPQGEALGQRFGSGMPGDVAQPKYEIVGIVGDARYRSLRETPPPTFFLPLNLTESPEFPLSLYVRSRGNADSMIFDVQETLNKIAPQLPFGRIDTMREVVAESLWQERLLASLASLFGIISLLLSACGLYAVMAYDIALRRKELGIRVALGAQKRDVAALLTKTTGKMVFVGVILGIVSLIGLTRVLNSYLYGVRSWDPYSLCSAVLIVCVVAAISVGRPILEAFRIQPSTALREE
jgi:predicted permease